MLTQRGKIIKLSDKMHIHIYTKHNQLIVRQEAFEKCWAHSPLRAAARRLF